MPTFKLLPFIGLLCGFHLKNQALCAFERDFYMVVLVRLDATHAVAEALVFNEFAFIVCTKERHLDPRVFPLVITPLAKEFEIAANGFCANFSTR